MTVTKHEIVTVKTSVDAASVCAALREIPTDADLVEAEIDNEWGAPLAVFTFRREMTDE